MPMVKQSGADNGPYQESPEEAAQWQALNVLMARFPAVRGTGKKFRFRIKRNTGPFTVPNTYKDAKSQTRDIFRWVYELDDPNYPAISGLAFFDKTGTTLGSKSSLTPLFRAVMLREPTQDEVKGNFNTDEMTGRYFDAKLQKGEARTTQDGKPDASRGGINYWVGDAEAIVDENTGEGHAIGQLRYNEEGVATSESVYYTAGASTPPTAPPRQVAAFELAGPPPARYSDEEMEEVPF